MRLALLSDIHANPYALRACLRKAKECGATQYALLGDLVGYGPDPGAIVEAAEELQNNGAWVLRGNHDEMAAKPPATAQTNEDASSQWTHEQLSQAQRDYLACLPLTHSAAPCYLVHASADAPERWRYVNNPIVARESLQAATKQRDIQYVLGGHVHQQALYYRGAGQSLMLFEPTPGIAIPVPRHRQWIATVGSCGQPRDGNRAAAFAMLDTELALLTFYRVPYDVSDVIALAKRKGLPESMIKRLETAR